jgi:hypothetical protein
MSRTRAHHETITKRKNPKHANPLGICRCVQCQYVRHNSSSSLEKIKRKQKRDWKSNKPAAKGYYPA